MGWSWGDRCSAVGGGGSFRSGASEEILPAAVCRRRLDRLVRQLRDERNIPCGKTRNKLNSIFFFVIVS